MGGAATAKASAARISWSELGRVPPEPGTRNLELRRVGSRTNRTNRVKRGEGPQRESRVLEGRREKRPGKQQAGATAGATSNVFGAPEGRGSRRARSRSRSRRDAGEPAGEDACSLWR